MSLSIRRSGAFAEVDRAHRSSANVFSRSASRATSPNADDEADDASEIFAARRDRLARAGLSKPSVRLAAFLIVLSHRNHNEGGDPSVIGDGLSCRFVGDLLGLSLDELELALLQLEMKGLIVPVPGLGLRITDVAGLVTLAGVDYGWQTDYS